MNKGTLPGLNADGWRSYNAGLLTAGSGGETQPVLDPIDGNTRYQFGRYNVIDKQFVVVEMQVQFVGTFSVGAGSAYVLPLPFPANRWSGPSASAPIPLGLGMCYFSITGPFVNMPTVVTLADPFPSLNGQEDSYVQCYCPYILSWGSGSLAAGTATVSHRCGYTPRAEDIEVVFTNATGTGTLDAMHSIQNITSTTFDVAARVLSAGHVMGFAWKIRGKPPTGSTGALMSPTTPWDWTRSNTLSPFGNIFIQATYEARF